MDYYNFDPEVYKLKFSSRGDATLSRRVVQLFQNVLLRLRLHNFFLGKHCCRRLSHLFIFYRPELALVYRQRMKRVV